MDTRPRKAEKRCARCGCLLPPVPCNAKYCAECKPIAYRERYKRKYKKIQEQVRTGEKLRTKKYGFISRERYVSLATDFIKAKYNIEGDYDDWRDASEEHEELNAIAMQEFANEVGLVYEHTGVR